MNTASTKYSIIYIFEYNSILSSDEYSITDALFIMKFYINMLINL